MPYGAEHYLLTIGGTLFAGEQFTMGLRSTVGSGTPDGDQASEEVVMDQIETVLRAWWPQSPSANSAVLTYFKYNRIATSGLYKHPYSNTRELVPTVAGGTPADIFPPQVALVATLETGFTRGLAHRGRIFCPAPKYALSGADGRLSTANAGLAATSVAGFIEDLNGVAGYGLTGVWSKQGNGSSRPITGVTVGRVLDTMRSRRAQLEEERAPAVPVGAG